MEKKMETRVAVIAIIIEDGSSAQEVNEFLHGAAQYIIGRMGIHYQHCNRCAAGYHQYVVRQNRPAERCIRQNGVFQCCFKRELKPQFI